MSAKNQLESKLREFLTDEEIKAGIEKGIIQMDIEKSENAEEGMSDFEKMSAEDQEKTYKETVEKAESMRKILGKEDQSLEKSFDKSEIEKSIKDNLEKSFGERIASLAKEKQTLAETNETLQKSLKDIQTSFDTLSQKVELISKSVPEAKSISSLSFIEKGVKDENGITTLSLSLHKEKVIGLMEKSRVNADDLMKGRIDESILGLSGGGAAPAEDVAFKLFQDHNVKLIN